MNVSILSMQNFVTHFGPFSVDTTVGESTTTPLAENDPADHNAMTFRLWENLGLDFLVKNNINNAFVCTPDGQFRQQFSSGKHIQKG